MYCSLCGEDVEEGEVGGTQLQGCYHFLCLNCLKTAVGETTVPGIRCSIKDGFHRCKGRLLHDELEFMVPEGVFANYLERISQGPSNYYENDDDEEEEGEEDGDDGEQEEDDDNPGPLELTDEEKQYGWAHKLKLIEELKRTKGTSPEAANAAVEKMPLIQTQFQISCSICMDDEVAPREGIVLKECFHMFCKDCLSNLVEHSDDATVKCPYIDGNYSCVFLLNEREIKGLVTDAVYEKHLLKSLKFGESSMENTFHCKTPDCLGWCVYDPGVIRFDCPLCRQPNCIKCQVIHAGSCEDFQNRIVQNANDQLSEKALEELVRCGEYMRCPKCRIPVQKVVGCDWIQCTCCKTEICWVTRGPRWGPAGKGWFEKSASCTMKCVQHWDTSGGCRCRVNNIPCHPQCGNCH